MAAAVACPVQLSMGYALETLVPGSGTSLGRQINNGPVKNKIPCESKHVALEVFRVVDVTDLNPSPNFPVVPGPAPDFIDVASSSSEHVDDIDQSDEASAMNVQPPDPPVEDLAWLPACSPTYGDGGWGSKGTGWGDWGHCDPAEEVLKNVHEDFKMVADDNDPSHDTALDFLDTLAWVKAQLYLLSDMAQLQNTKLPTFTQQQLAERLMKLRAKETPLTAEFARVTEDARLANHRKSVLSKAMEDLKEAEERLHALHLVPITCRPNVI
ncbi:hypothetical protein BT96DRAFT_941107 [Gymnopus androsaceus JB14]|uniref:Uncharacterized protein n=1 Tax=Gymnopus androsaceus JB14 TaxID=1447944 RepID=A0A6A4HJ99_9AGAR|nr:hypothetical protein BT96DRAFT_941107 [Gymnopus androsaceus JB14]